MIELARAAGLSDEDVLELLRVLGRGLAQAAETLRAMPLKLALKPGISELELAAEYARASAALYPMVDPLVSSVLALHLRHATESEVTSALERSGGRLPGSREVGVCFADLVGFTRLARKSPPRSWAASPCAWKRSRRGLQGAGAPGQDDRRRRHARLPRSPARCSRRRSP